jgi:hypothetical protein
MTAASCGPRAGLLANPVVVARAVPLDVEVPVPSTGRSRPITSHFLGVGLAAKGPKKCRSGVRRADLISHLGTAGTERPLRAFGIVMGGHGLARLRQSLVV